MCRDPVWGNHIAAFFSSQEIFSQNERNASGGVSGDLISWAPSGDRPPATAKTGFSGFGVKADLPKIREPFRVAVPAPVSGPDFRA